VSREHWFTAPLGSAEYRVYLADGSDHLLHSGNDEDGPCEGATDHETCSIVIRSDLPRKRIPEVVVHELMHAAAHISGISHTMRWKLVREEQVVHAMAPMIAHGLVGGGLWKTPRRKR
jgi:hypothetical protein